MKTLSVRDLQKRIPVRNGDGSEGNYIHNYKITIRIYAAMQNAVGG